MNTPGDVLVKVEVICFSLERPQWQAYLAGVRTALNLVKAMAEQHRLDLIRGPNNFLPYLFYEGYQVGELFEAIRQTIGGEVGWLTEGLLCRPDLRCSTSFSVGARSTWIDLERVYDYYVIQLPRNGGMKLFRRYLDRIIEGIDEI